MINPSTLDLKTLPWLPLTEKSAFPKQAAIYFAIDSLGCVQYIGRSVNVRARWGSHHKYSQLDAIGGVKVAYLFVDMPELLPQIETALIEYFQPSLNIIGFQSTEFYANRKPKLKKEEIKVNILFELKKIRNQREVSQNELARLCEMSVTNIQKYEQQKMKSIPFETLALFCQVLDCQPGELFQKVDSIK